MSFILLCLVLYNLMGVFIELSPLVVPFLTFDTNVEIGNFHIRMLERNAIRFVIFLALYLYHSNVLRSMEQQ
jgi:hypothetical protein